MGLALRLSKEANRAVPEPMMVRRPGSERPVWVDEARTGNRRMESRAVER